MAWYKFKETKLRTLEREHYEIKELSNNILCGWEINTKDASTLVTNLSLMDSKQIEKIEDKKLFLVDEDDFEAYYKMHEENVDVEEISLVFSNLKKCSKHHHKNFYIRTLPVPLASIQQKKEANEEHGKVIIKRDENRVFIDDIMTVVPLVLARQQHKNTKWTDKKLKTYYNQWQSGNENVEASISISEFHAVLEELDCDKSQITLVEDPMHELSKKEVAEEFGFVRTCAPNLKVVMDGPQSIFFVFHNLVNAINWRNEMCTDHERCNQTLKPKILSLFYHIGSFKPGSYFSITFLIAEIEKIKDMCPAKYRLQRETPDYVLQGIRSTTHTHVEYYYQVVIKYNLVLLDVGLPGLPDMNFFQVFSFRFMLQFGWVIQFFTEDEDKTLRLCIVHSLVNLVPEYYWQKCMQLAYNVLAQTKAVFDKWREEGVAEESEASLEGPLPGAPKNVRPQDRPAPGGPPPLYAPENCCETCKERLKETGSNQMNALVVKEACMPYEKELLKMPGLLELQQKNAKTIEELKRKINEKERNRKPTHIELKARNEQLTKILANAKQQMDDLTVEKRVLIETSNSLKKTTEELKKNRDSLQVEVNNKKENDEPVVEEVQVPEEVQEKEKRIQELKSTQKNLQTIVESQSLHIQEMAK